jgi:hypothetical protein
VRRRDPGEWRTTSLAMMHHTFSRLDKPGPDWNAFMESFCVHARNLKQFVTNDKGKGSNSVICP